MRKGNRQNTSEISRQDQPGRTVVLEEFASGAEQTVPLCHLASCSTQKYLNEIETLMNIQQAISGQLNLSSLLQLIADEARKLTSAHSSFVYILENDHLVLQAFSSEELGNEIIGYQIPVASSLAGKSIETGKALMISNVVTDDEYIYDEIVRFSGPSGCYLTIPLVYGNRSVGAIAVADQFRQCFRDDSLRVLNMLAPSAVIGIENARLYQEQQERRLEAEGRHQMAESLRVMLAIVNSNRSLQEILDYIVNQVSSRLLDCQATAILTHNYKDHTLTIQAAHGLQTNLIDNQLLPGYDAAFQAIRDGQLVTVSDALEIDEDSNLDTSLAEWAMAGQLLIIYRAWMAVPLKIKGEIYGAIVIYFNAPRNFTLEEINLALMFSDEVALAIENARLRIQAEQAAVSAERNRLARELHDAVSQTLFSANLIAEVLPRLWERDQVDARDRLVELGQLTRGAQAEMRTLLFELRPAVFSEAKLGDLLKHLTQAISVRSQIPIKLDILADEKMPPEVQTVLYRITQEALNNVSKHANPSQATVTLTAHANAAELIICDNGCGFNPSGVSSEHFGLSIMKERAASIHAALKVTSKPGCGTSVSVKWAIPTSKE